MPSLQEMIQQALNDLWSNGLNNPQSPFYLPTVVATSGFAPAGGYPAGKWPVGDITGPGGTQGAQNICATTAPFGQIQIPTPGALPNLALSDVFIQNLVNAVMPAAPLSTGSDGLTVTASINFSNLQIVGNFVLKQQCCLSNDQTTCLANTTNTQTGSGDFTMTIGTSTAAVVLLISSLAPNVLVVQCNSINYTVNFSTMNAIVHVTSIPPAQRDAWDAQVEKAFNYQPTQTVIVQAMNQTLGGGGAMQQIGAALTTNIDNYLRQSHQYPFDQSFGALYS
jgi:hypothetical protein